MNQNPKISPPPQIIIHSSKHIPLAITFAALLLISLAGNVYLTRTISSSSGLPAYIYSHELPTPPPPTPTPDPMTDWPTTSFAQISFIYPKYWHLAIQEELNGISTLAISPDPIVFGPNQELDTIFNVQQIPISDSQDPKKLLKKEMSQINDTNYKNIISQTTETDYGTIYYLKAVVIGEYMYGKPVEKYFLLSPKNQSLLIFSLDFIDNISYSKMLKEIVSSVN